MSIPIQTSVSAPITRTTAGDLAESYPRIQQRRKSMNLALKIARAIQGEDETTVREAINMIYPEPSETVPMPQPEKCATACQGEVDKDPESVIA